MRETEKERDDRGRACRDRRDETPPLSVFTSAVFAAVRSCALLAASRTLSAAAWPSGDYASLYRLRFVNFAQFFWPICGQIRSSGRNGEADSHAGHISSGILREREGAFTRQRRLFTREFRYVRTRARGSIQ